RGRTGRHPADLDRRADRRDRQHAGGRGRQVADHDALPEVEHRWCRREVFRHRNHRVMGGGMNAEQIASRIAELTEKEKRCWAELNYGCGARAELERILAEWQCDDGSPEPSPPASLSPDA